MLIPANGKLIVKIDETPKTVGSFLLVEDLTLREFICGSVISASKGYTSMSGNWVDLSVFAGDKVWYKKFNSAPITIGVETFHILDERDVLAIERE